jgi:dolichol-phosphate mannosyltransferase
LPQRPAVRQLISPRALMFGAVGASGLALHLAVLTAVRHTGLAFAWAQAIAALCAMTSNYLINNAVTYRDRRKRGLALLTGYLRFCLFCAAGLAASVATGSLLRRVVPIDWVCGAAGAVAGAAWNYVTTSLAVW